MLISTFYNIGRLAEDIVVSLADNYSDTADIEAIITEYQNLPLNKQRSFDHYASVLYTLKDNLESFLNEYKHFAKKVTYEEENNSIPYYEEDNDDGDDGD